MYYGEDKGSQVSGEGICLLKSVVEGANKILEMCAALDVPPCWELEACVFVAGMGIKFWSYLGKTHFLDEMTMKGSFKLRTLLLIEGSN